VAGKRRSGRVTNGPMSPLCELLVGDEGPKRKDYGVERKKMGGPWYVRGRSAKKRNLTTNNISRHPRR